MTTHGRPCPCSICMPTCPRLPLPMHAHTCTDACLHPHPHPHLPLHPHTHTHMHAHMRTLAHAYTHTVASCSRPQHRSARSPLSSTGMTPACPPIRRGTVVHGGTTGSSMPRHDRQHKGQHMVVRQTVRWAAVHTGETGAMTGCSVQLQTSVGKVWFGSV